MLEILRRDVIDAKSAYYLYVSRSICLSACIGLAPTDEFSRNLILEIFRVQPTRHDFPQFIYFCKMLYTFQMVFLSIIRSSKLYIQRQVFVRPLLLPAAILARLAAGSSNGLTNT